MSYVVVNMAVAVVLVADVVAIVFFGCLFPLKV